MEGSVIVSVIIPTYNRAALLMRAAESVLAQTVSELELIIVDDGSSDHTPDIVSRLNDPRVQYIRLDRNRGACYARNVGITHAKGAYIAFQDSDDVWAPTKLEKQLAYIVETGADIVFSAFDRHQDGKTQRFPGLGACDPARPLIFEELLKENVISMQTVLGKKDCFLQHPFRDQFPRFQDWELMLRLSRAYEIRYQDETLVDMYVQTDSISKNIEAGFIAYQAIYNAYQDVIVKSEPLTRRYADAMAFYKLQGRQNPWRCYFSLVSWRASPAANLFLIEHGFLWLFRGITKKTWRNEE